MISGRNFALVVACLGFVFTVQGCGDVAEAPMDPATSALGRDDGTVTVPMRLDATFMWVVPGASPADCPDLIDPSTGELFTAEGFGFGEATTLGRFEIAELDHPTVNLCSLVDGDPTTQPTPADVTRSGEFEFVAADGSTIFGSYDFFAPGPGVPGAFFTFSVEGGTGRLAGATGVFNALPEESGDPGPDDPTDVLLLGKVTWDPAVFEGEVTIPSP